jgi:hypothetical protein
MAYLNYDAIIPEAKITKYLLIYLPKDNKSTFLKKAGYNIDNWQQLEQDIRQQILPLNALSTENTKYGQKYEIIGELTGPNGITLNVITVWIIDHQGVTRFVTLVPNK